MTAYIEDIAQHEGQTVTLRGWLHNRRSSGKIHFLTVRDGSGFIQCVMSKKAVGDEIFTKADHLAQESAVIVEGTVRADARAPGGYELDVTTFDVVSGATDYPITPKEHGVDYLMDRRHLWIRAPRQQAILRIRHEVINAVRDFFNSRGFILADTPIFTPSACEGTTTLFPVQYFEHETAYLTQSGQLYNEANAMALGRDLLLRADVPRREVEDPPPPHRVLDGRARSGVRDAGRRDGRWPKGWWCRWCSACSRTRGAGAEGRSSATPRSSRRSQAPFPRISYDEAVEIIQKKGLPFEWGGDFGAPDETALSEEFDRPVCVHRYPSAVKAFYMKPDPNRAGGGARRRRARARGLRRDHRRRRAPRRLRPAARSASRSTTCRRKRSSGISICAATAACRTAASAWASSASSAGSAGWSTCARRFRIRGCCTGSIRDNSQAAKLQIPKELPERPSAKVAALELRWIGLTRRFEPSRWELEFGAWELKIGFLSLGCPKNLVDGEVMLGIAREAGHEITPDATDADVLVVNTCAFIDNAKQESIDAILEMAALKGQGTGKRLVVTGCLAERYRDELRKEIPEIDAVLGTGEVPQILEAIGTRGRGLAVRGPDESRASARLQVRPLPFYTKAPSRLEPADRGPRTASPEPRRRPTYIYDADTPRLLTTPKHFAYVKIAEGCDYTCAFCIIPTLRGSYRSRTIDSIVREARGAGGARRARAAADLAGHQLLRHRPRRARRAGAAAARAEQGRRARLDPAALPLPDDDHRRRARRRWRSARRSAATWTCRCSTRRPTC